MNFCDVFEDVTKKGRKLQTAEYKVNGKYPIFDQGQNLIAGYTDEESGLFSDVPVVLFGDHTRIVKYIDEPSFLGDDGDKILKSKLRDVNVKYLYYAVSAIDVPNTGYNRHYKWLKQASISIVDRNEQNRIVCILDKIDNLITVRKQQLQKTDELVKARFVEMFGDIIYNTMGWPQYTFSEIASSRLGKMLDAKQQTGKYQFPYLANFNVQWFRFELRNLNKMDFDEEDQAEFELKEGDLIVCEGGEIGRCAIWHNEIQPCYFQKALHRVRCNTDIVLPEYLARWFQFNCEHDGFAVIEGAKATIAHLPGAKLKTLQVGVPPISLQDKFVEFVTQVDKTEVAIQNSLDRLERLKQSLTQMYFR